MKEHKKLCQKQVSKVTLHFVWGHLMRKQTVVSSLTSSVGPSLDQEIGFERGRHKISVKVFSKLVELGEAGEGLTRHRLKVDHAEERGFLHVTAFGSFDEVGILSRPGGHPTRVNVGVVER